MNSGVTPGNDTITRTFDDLERRQLEIYARELQEHFDEEYRLRQELEKHFDQEHRLRGELEERNRNLEQRLREIAAIEGMNKTIWRQTRKAFVGLSRRRL